MLMMQDRVRVDCLPENAHCKVDETKRSPMDIEECPKGNEICSGDCIYYEEDCFGKEKGEE